MAYTQFTEDMEILQKENDRPNALGNPKRSAADMKELFDEAGIKIKDYLNNTLLPELDNTAGDLVTDEAAIAQNATDIVALKAKKRFVYADADIAYNTTTTTSILKAKLHPSGEVGDYVIGKNGGVAVIVSQLDATRWNITTQQMSVRPPYSASQIGYSSQSEIYPTPPADVEEALAGLEGNVEGLINDVESLESSVTDLEARTKLVYYTGVIDTTKSTSTDQTGYLPDYKPNDDIIPGDCFIDDYGSIGVVTAISGTTVTYRYTGEKFNGLAENVLYGSLSPIYPAAPGNVSQALSGLEGVAETLVDDVGDLKAEASFVFFEGTISTTSTVLSQYSTTSHFYPNVKGGCYFVDSKGAVGRVLGVSGTDVVFVYAGMRVVPNEPSFDSVTVQDSSGGVTLMGGYTGTEPVLGLSETGDNDLPVRVMNVATPTLGTDAANKAYVDAQSVSVTPAAVVTATGAMTSEQQAQTRENIGAGEPLTPEQIAEGAGAWLEDNLATPSTPPIDSSLSVANAAADAKATGDAVGELKNTLDNNFNTIIGKNLINPNKCVVGAIQSNGSVSTNGAWANYTTSELIALEANTNYSFCACNPDKWPNVNSRKLLLLYTDESTPDASTYISQTGVANLSFNSGSTYKYVRTAWQTDYLPLLESGTLTPTTYQEYREKEVVETFLGDNAIAQVQDISGNVLYGKKWAVCGDSFTYGATSTVIPGGKYAGERFVYPYLIGNRNNMNIVRFFEGGKTLAWPLNPGTFANSLTNPNASSYYQNIPSDIDYITFYLGINDQSHSAQDSPDGESTEGLITLGTIDDAGTNTYYGAWNNVLTWLIENRPNAKIGIIVTNGLSNGTYQGASGADWVAAQKAIARKYGIPYIDMNGDDRTPVMLRTLNTNIPDAIKNKLIEKWAVDPSGSNPNTHPNDAAHEYESKFIENFLRSL